MGPDNLEGQHNTYATELATITWERRANFKNIVKNILFPIWLRKLAIPMSASSSNCPICSTIDVSHSRHNGYSSWVMYRAVMFPRNEGRAVRVSYWSTRLGPAPSLSFSSFETGML
jgi:hypothetical protein